MEIKKTCDVSNHHVFALIVGASGSGKTTLASTLNPEETIILSAESGLLSIKDHSIDVIEINKFQDLIDSYKFLNEQTKYKNIFIDSLTEIGEMLFHEIKPDFTKAQSFGLYEAYGDRIIALLKAFRDMTQYNIYFTALDKMVAKDFTEVVSVDLKQKSLAKRLPALFDEVFYLQIHEREEGTKVRALCTDNSIIDFAKDRSGNLDNYEQANLQTIFNKIFKGEVK